MYIAVHGWDCCATMPTIWVNPNLSGTLSELGLDSENFGNDRNPEQLIEALKKHGFKEVKTQTLTWGDNF